MKKKTQNTPLSGQFQNTIEKSQKVAKWIPLAHKYIAAQGLNYFNVF